MSYRSESCNVLTTMKMSRMRISFQEVKTRLFLDGYHSTLRQKCACAVCLKFFCCVHWRCRHKATIRRQLRHRCNDSANPLRMVEYDCQWNRNISAIYT